MKKKILIKGAGEQATGTAHRLFQCGFHVVMTELSNPQVVRRTVSFAECVYQGNQTVESVRSECFAVSKYQMLDSFDWSMIPVFIDPECQLLNLWKPDVLIDARIMKRNQGNRKGDAPLLIGLGPGIEAGKDVDVVIETNRGHNLGRIISNGYTEENTGIPGTIGSYASKRVLRSPCDGTFRSRCRITDQVNAGQSIGSVNDQEIYAEIPGIIRGLIYPGSKVSRGLKIGDIDPRGSSASCHTISDKARTISGAVLESILAFLIHREKR